MAPGSSRASSRDEAAPPAPGPGGSRGVRWRDREGAGRGGDGDEVAMEVRAGPAGVDERLRPRALGINEVAGRVAGDEGDVVAGVVRVLHLDRRTRPRAPWFPRGRDRTFGRRRGARAETRWPGAGGRRRPVPRTRRAATRPGSVRCCRVARRLLVDPRGIEAVLGPFGRVPAAGLRVAGLHTGRDLGRCARCVHRPGPPCERRGGGAGAEADRPDEQPDDPQRGHRGADGSGEVHHRAAEPDEDAADRGRPTEPARIVDGQPEVARCGHGPSGIQAQRRPDRRDVAVQVPARRASLDERPGPLDLGGVLPNVEAARRQRDDDLLVVERMARHHPKRCVGLPGVGLRGVVGPEIVVNHGTGPFDRGAGPAARAGHGGCGTSPSRPTRPSSRLSRRSRTPRRRRARSRFAGRW